MHTILLFLLPSDIVQHAYVCDLQQTLSLMTHNFPGRRKPRKQKETHTPKSTSLLHQLSARLLHLLPMFLPILFIFRVFFKQVVLLLVSAHSVFTFHFFLKKKSRKNCRARTTKYQKPIIAYTCPVIDARSIRLSRFLLDFFSRSDYAGTSIYSAASIVRALVGTSYWLVCL